MVFVNMLDRERADFFRTLESLKAAFGPHVVATEIPIGSEHEVRGVIDLVDMKAYEYDGDGRDNCREIPIPDELPAQAEEYREKLMDEVAEVSDDADGALPRGRGDLPRGDRHRAQGRHEPRRHLPGRLRRRHAQPRRRTACSTRSSRTCPSPVKHGGAGAARGHARARRGRRAVRLRLQDAGRPVRRAHQPLPRLPGRDAATTRQVLNTRAHAKERIGQLLRSEGKETAHADEFGPGDIGAVAKLKETRAGDWLAARDEPIAMPRDQAARAGHGVRDRAEGQGRRGQGLHRAAPPAGGGPDDRPAPRPADRRADRRRPLADPRRGRSSTA